MRYIFAFLILLCSTAGYSQEIEGEFNSSDLKDSIIVNKLIDEALQLLRSYPDSSRILFLKARNISKDIGFSRGRIDALLKLYSLAYLKRDNNQAYLFIKEAYDITKRDQLRVKHAESANQIGHYYLDSEHLDSVYYYLMEALNIYKSLDLNYQSGMVHSNLSFYYKLQSDTTRAIYHLKKAVGFGKEKEGKSSSIQVNMYHLINLYQGYGMQEERINAIEDYLVYSSKHAKLDKNYDFFHQHIFSKVSTKNPEEKVAALLEDIEMHEKLNNQYGLYFSYMHLGDIYFNNLKNRQLAEEAFLTCSRMEYVSKKAIFLLNSNKTLAEFYEKCNKKSKAFTYLKRFNHIKDSLMSLDVLARVKEYETKYQTAETQLALAQKEIELSNQKAKQNRLMILLIAAGVLVILFSYFLFYRTRINKELQGKNNKIQKALEEKEILLKEIHHRVKNNLQVVSGLLKWQASHLEDSKALDAFNEGQNRVQSMAIIHQKLYQSDNLTGIDMGDYIHRLSHSLFRSYNLDADHVTLKTDIESLNLDIDTVIPLGLILNELISNALKHAFPDAKAGEIAVKLFQDESSKELLLMVKDNGVGMEEKVNKSQSFGWELIETLSKKLKAKLTIENHDGTRIQLRIKNYKVA